jgi:hypothetical protein
MHMTILEVVKNRPLSPAHLDKSYPGQMPFYLYGSLAAGQCQARRVAIRVPRTL